jgi:hypothetical protein
VSLELLNSLWIATALMLIIEGIAPFLSPPMFRQAMLKMMAMTDRQLRMIGFFCMIAGLLLLHWIH